MVHVSLIYLSERREFPSVLALQEKILDDCSRLDFVELELVA
jgi:hypothetical protein